MSEGWRVAQAGEREELQHGGAAGPSSKAEQQGGAAWRSSKAEQQGRAARPSRATKSAYLAEVEVGAWPTIFQGNGGLQELGSLGRVAAQHILACGEREKKAKETGKRKRVCERGQGEERHRPGPKRGRAR